ncbi:MAG: hypothetical protein ACQESM_06190, partial [Bacteroidota bacterium]
ARFLPGFFYVHTFFEEMQTSWYHTDHVKLVCVELFQSKLARAFQFIKFAQKLRFAKLTVVTKKLVNMTYFVSNDHIKAVKS